MNTEHSDLFVMRWREKSNPRKRATVAVERRFNATPDKLFPLLCPTTEFDWLPGWNCELLHSKSGYAEYNAIFRTDFFGFEEIWVCSHYEPGKAIEYCRFSQDLCAVMEIKLVDHMDGTATGRWVITLSALNEQGNAMVEELESKYQGMDKPLDAIAHYVDTGQMLG
jgi:hypothetical protein